MRSIKIAHNPILHVRGKHIIEVHHHFVCEQVEFKKVDLVHVSTHG
jgi:hypothetical protein